MKSNPDLSRRTLMGLLAGAAILSPVAAIAMPAAPLPPTDNVPLWRVDDDDDDDDDRRRRSRRRVRRRRRDDDDDDDDDDD